MNGDAIIQRLGMRIGELVAENEILRQQIIELQEVHNVSNEQNPES